MHNIIYVTYTYVLSSQWTRVCIFALFHNLNLQKESVTAMN